MFVPHVNKIRRSPSKSSLPRAQKTGLTTVYESSPTNSTTARKTSRPLPPLPVRSGLTKSNSAPGISSALDNPLIDEDMGPRDGVFCTPEGWREMRAALDATPCAHHRRSSPANFVAPGMIGTAFGSPSKSGIPVPTGNFAVKNPRAYTPVRRERAAQRNFSLPLKTDNSTANSDVSLSDSGSESDSALTVIEPEGHVREPVREPESEPEPEPEREFGKWYGWQVNAFWSGRFNGVMNRLKTESFSVAVNSPAMMEASLDNTRLYDEYGNAKMGSRTTPETAGLSYIKYKELAITLEAFRIIRGECGDEKAVKSLLSWQTVYATIEKMPELLPVDEANLKAEVEEKARRAEEEAKVEAEAEEKARRTEEETKVKAEEEARHLADELIAEEEAEAAAKAKAAASGSGKKGKGKGKKSLFSSK